MIIIQEDSRSYQTAFACRETTPSWEKCWPRNKRAKRKPGSHNDNDICSSRFPSDPAIPCRKAKRRRSALLYFRHIEVHPERLNP
jgi:hypothetical protein